LVYVSGDDCLEIFLVHRGHASHRFAAVGSRELAQRVRVAREKLQRSPDTDAIESLGDLHHLLLSPFARELRSISRLIIVPHGALGALPFAALWNEGTGRFLIQDKTITYAPTVAAIGSLSTSTSATGIAVFAPDPEQLPGSRKEATTIARMSKLGVSYVGRSSTKQAVRRALEQGRIVHIAAHGSHNAQNPLFSRVVVEHRTARSNSDGTLAVHEIMGLSARSPLVFLSGCETGVSTAGEGVFSVETDDSSLSQAFLFAGASNVVATLWPVVDSDASTIAADFYRALNRGRSAVEALATAQRAAISSKGRMTWAAYTIASAGTAKPH
jgi:CHAT domain-containing protein